MTPSSPPSAMPTASWAAGRSRCDPPRPPRTARPPASPGSRRRSWACLDEAQRAELAELGRRVEAHFGEPRDVEWAFVDGRFWLLQARPITAAGQSEREAVRNEEIAALRKRASKRGTVWGRFNLSEV